MAKGDTYSKTYHETNPVTGADRYHTYIVKDNGWPRPTTIEAEGIASKSEDSQRIASDKHQSKK
jgi:hypothetical protein